MRETSYIYISFDGGILHEKEIWSETAGNRSCDCRPRHYSFGTLDCELHSCGYDSELAERKLVSYTRRICYVYDWQFDC